MLLKNIQKDIVNSLKEKKPLRVETLRGVVAAVKKAAIDKRIDITDELTIEVLLKEKKIVQEMIDTCPSNRSELLDEYNLKMNIINDYAPKMISDENEIKNLIKDIVNNEIEFTKSNRGQLMKLIAPTLKGKADMKTVNKVIGDMLI